MGFRRAVVKQISFILPTESPLPRGRRHCPRVPRITPGITRLEDDISPGREDNEGRLREVSVNHVRGPH